MLVSPEGLELAPPPRTLVPAGNIRTQGERATRALYRHNREATARVLLGPGLAAGATYAQFIAQVRSLLAWLDAPPAVPVTLQFQPFNASQPVYLDVVGCAHDLPTDEEMWLRMQLEPIEIVFLCRPGLRGSRIVLDNLAVNPGFEQGSGPGVQVFNDAFANFNAYVVQAGGALAQDVKTFADVVDGLNGAAGASSTTLSVLRYFRLDEASGTTAYDASGNLQNGTTHGSPTQGVAGLLTGDSDTCYTFAAASSEYVSVPGSGLPSGNGAMSLMVLFKFAANPAATAMLWGYGDTTTAHHCLQLYLDTTGKLNVNVGGTTILVTASAVSTGTAHLAVVTWDGTTMSLYLDNAAALTATPGAQAIPSTPTVNMGATSAPANYWNGQMDEPCCLSGCLTSAQVTALYNAMTTTPAATANTMVIPNGGREMFGSPAWAAINNWQTRFRFLAGLTATFYLHYVDSNDYLAVVVNGSTLVVNQVVGGTTHQLASVAAVLVNGVQYWLQATQFPTSPNTAQNGNPPDVQAVLLADNGGAPGTVVASAVAPTFDSVTALAGRPQIAASGAALGIGGAFSNVHTVALFGPGAWSFAGLIAAATGESSGAWEQTAANTYSNGPVQSYGAGRIDLAPAGQVDAYWNLYNGGAPAGSQAMACGAAGDTVAASVWVKSSGLGSGAVLRLDLRMFDVNGNLLSSVIVASLTGNQSAWTQLSGSVVTVAKTAYLDVRVHVVDTTAGASANGVVWWDNAQVWDVTTTGAALGAMPYCELRFTQSPATLVVSGLVGDLPCPAHVGLGTYLASWAAGSKLVYALGRRAAASAAFQGAAPSVGFFGTTFTPTGIAVLDPTSYGGYYVKATVGTAGWNPRALSPKAADALGTYHVLARYRTFDASPALVQVRAKTEELLDPWYQDVNTAKSIGTYFGPYVNPLAAGNVWTVADAGQVQIPPFLRGALRDDSQVFEVPRGEWVGSAAGGAEGDAGWLALLPVDGSVLAGVVNNPANSFLTIATSWLWVYVDGLLVNRAGSGPGGMQDGPGWTYSLEAGPLSAPGHGGGGPGTQGTGTVNVNNGADPYLMLDPTVQIAGQSGGINQVVGYVADGAGAVLALHAQVSYSPLYLWPR